MTEEAALSRYEPIFRQYGLYGDFGRLRLLRAAFYRLPLLRRYVDDLMYVSWYDTHAAL